MTPATRAHHLQRLQFARQQCAEDRQYARDCGDAVRAAQLTTELGMIERAIGRLLRRPTVIGIAPVAVESAPTPTKAPVSGRYRFVAADLLGRIA